MGRIGLEYYLSQLLEYSQEGYDKNISRLYVLNNFFRATKTCNSVNLHGLHKEKVLMREKGNFRQINK